eukprot:TRINITY_DN235_c1_g2_i2.p1 TRINITY_DN235_c1_g2~~TRINITY_DN235_c1_g2_i2.p1  ORF type:complete len:1021 (+),score=292.91 TRINITY_DN235_c1_g2_i2:145-3207(+)
MAGTAPTANPYGQFAGGPPRQGGYSGGPPPGPPGPPGATAQPQWGSGGGYPPPGAPPQYGGPPPGPPQYSGQYAAGPPQGGGPYPGQQPTAPPETGGNVLTVKVYARDKGAAVNWTHVEGVMSGGSDCGSEVVATFGVYSAAAAGLSPWKILKAKGSKGNWVCPADGEHPPGDVRELATFWAKSVDPAAAAADPSGLIFSRFRHAKVGAIIRTDPDSSTAVGPAHYADTAWRRIGAFAPAGSQRALGAGCTAEGGFWQLCYQPTVGRYPVRTGCRLNLFQSAHVGCYGEQALPRMPTYLVDPELSGAKKRHVNADQAWQYDDDDETRPRPFMPRNAWEEMFHAILTATEFIYIVGWSVSTKITLVRERPVHVKGYPSETWRKTVGELLKMKSEERSPITGEYIKVNLILWNEGPHAVAGTFSGETQRAFAGTKVNCKAMYRMSEASADKTGWSACFTHHQKCVILDQPVLDNPTDKRRRVVCFMGGLDVTIGRWDSPEKHLFDTLQTWHKGDFYQNCHAGGTDTVGPRQPWQDVHCKLEGAVARDLATNFEHRWRTQCSEDSVQMLYGGHLGLGTMSGQGQQHTLLPANEDMVQQDDHPENWKMQFFRSIDQWSDSKQDWSSWGSTLEKDIEHAYANAIGKSERFIYFENQYFMGSSLPLKGESDLNFPEFARGIGFNWPGWTYVSTESKKSGVAALVGRAVDAVGSLAGSGTGRTPQNRIPLLIAARICKAIHSQQDFCVYVCIPLFPEGGPADAAMQEIVHWQYQTIKAIYRCIQEKLTNVGSRRPATDYFNVFCLGQRQGGQPAQPPAGCDNRLRQMIENRRHMIYVHSKFAVFDDEYIILGSANINDRSMDGDRDTEVAIGAWQPRYSKEFGQRHAQGAVRSFRIALWAEHLRLISRHTGEPSDPRQAAQKAAAEENWHQYVRTIEDPQSQACMQFVRAHASQAWLEHLGHKPLSGHANRQCSHMMEHATASAALASALDPRAEQTGGWGAMEIPDAPGALIIGAPSSLVPDWMTC